MTELFLVVLGAVWLIVYLPAALKAKRRGPLFTAESWRRRMRAIAPPRISSSGRWVVAPASSGALDRGARRALKKRQERRKQLLLGLLALIPASLTVAIVEGGRWWDLHFISYALVAVYVALLVEDRRARSDSLHKVRSLAGARGTTPERERYAERRA